MRNQKSEWHSGVGHIDSCCDRRGEFWTPPIHIYRKYQEKQQRKTQSKFVHGGPVIGGYLKSGTLKTCLKWFWHLTLLIFYIWHLILLIFYIWHLTFNQWTNGPMHNVLFVQFFFHSTERSETCRKISWIYCYWTYIHPSSLGRMETRENLIFVILKL